MADLVHINPIQLQRLMKQYEQRKEVLRLLRNVDL